MPLPRFERLPAESRAAILAVARGHFARDGKTAASFNQIIADAGISKTSAYHYFDGKDDLFNAVIADAADRILTALGRWQDADSPSAFWAQLRAGTLKLLAYLRDSPEDRTVLSGYHQSTQDPDPWIRDLVANGLRLGVISPDPSAGLMTTVTAGIFAALDAWALDHPQEPEDVTLHTLILLLSRLWNTPQRGGR